MTLEVEHFDGVPVARPREDIDAANAAAVHDELTKLPRDGTDSLVVDLTDTRYLDSAGIDMLFRLAERLRQRRARLVVVIAPSSNLARLAQIVSLADAMPIHGSVAEALEACGRRSASGCG